MPLLADTVYTFVGSPFTVASAPFTTLDSVTGSFTVSAPLAPNQVTSVTPSQFSFSDGLYTFNSTSTAPWSYPSTWVLVGTDSSGDITGWLISLTALDGKNQLITDNLFGNLSEGCVTSCSSDIGIRQSVGTLEGFNTGEPGVWSSTTTDSSPSATPEPSTLLLLGSGLLGLAALRPKTQAYGTRGRLGLDVKGGELQSC